MREGFGPRGLQNPLQAGCLQDNPSIDDGRFGEQKPVARVDRLQLRGGRRCTADEADPLLHRKQTVERDC